MDTTIEHLLLLITGIAALFSSIGLLVKSITVMLKLEKKIDEHSQKLDKFNSLNDSE